MVGKLTGEVVTKEELYEAAWATDCGLSMSKYAEAYQINQSSADCPQRKFLTALAHSCSRRYKPFSRARRGQGNLLSGKHNRDSLRDKGGGSVLYTPASFIPLKYQRDFFCK